MRYVAVLFKPPGNLPAWSAVYTPAYADNFARNVRKHATANAEVVILTDYPRGEFTEGQTILRFKGRQRGWASLMEMFRPEVVGDAAILCGLDTVFVGPLGPIEDAVRRYGYIAPRDPLGITKLTNAVIGIDRAHAAGVWKAWQEDRKRATATKDYDLFGAFSEMRWLDKHAAANTTFDIMTPGAVVSFKAHVRAAGGGIPSEDAAIVYFHGEPKPHTLTEPWVIENWGTLPSAATSGGTRGGMSIKTYEEIYRRQAAGDPAWENYGHTSHGHGLVKELATTCKQEGWAVLDVGCGHNEFAAAMRDEGVACVGLDPACESADLVCSVEDVDRTFDLVTAFDVLEHLQPDEVHAFLTQLRRIAPRYLFTVSTRPAVAPLRWEPKRSWLDRLLWRNRNPIEEPLHPTVRPQQWWAERLADVSQVGGKIDIFLTHPEGFAVRGEWSRRAEPEPTQVEEPVEAAAGV